VVVTESFSDIPVVKARVEFAVFYEREYRQVAGLAFVLTNERAAAEDLAQEAFASAYRRWSDVGGMDQPGAWVRRVVVNKAMSRFRRMAVEGRALTRLNEATTTPPASAESVAVWEAIRRLSPKQAEIIVLTYYIGMSNSESAKLMGCSIETARTHLKRARSRLAEWLEESQ
jgi:RNA polymerase sigma-70 factor (ECF subfamily)